MREKNRDELNREVDRIRHGLAYILEVKEPSPKPPDLTAAELAAAVRFVARETPHLALALVFSIVTNPEAVTALGAAGSMIEPEHLAELADLDEALRIAVESSRPACRRRSAASARLFEPDKPTERDRPT